MELMNYNRIKPKSNIPIISFLLFILLGAGIVVYGIITEPKPMVIGENALKQVDSPNVQDENKLEETIEYEVTTILRNETNRAYKANISIPGIKVNGAVLLDINNEIKERFYTTYETLAEDGEQSLENEFTYKVSFVKYENSFKDNTKIVSFLFTETITAKGSETFSTKKYAYSVNLNTREMMELDEIGAQVLGFNYRNIVKKAIKETVIDKKLQTEEEYVYALTGTENCYVKDGIFHIIFNAQSPFEKLTTTLDLEVKSDEG